MRVNLHSLKFRKAFLALLLSLMAVYMFTEKAMAMNTEPEWKASWIWAQRDSYTGYNDTIEARKVLELPKASSVLLRITADTRYRLYVNDTWVNDGPSRSWPDHYQYDVIDVSSYVREGENTIRIIAKFFGIGTFHQIPQEAGLLAQLEVRDDTGKVMIFGTDGTWEVRDAHAWLRNTPKQSVQMGPFEIYDARLSNTAFSPAVVRYPATAGPWKHLEPRDTALLTRIPFAIKALTSAQVVKQSNARTFIFPTSNWLYDDIVYSNHHVVTTGAFATILDLDEDGGEVVVDADGNTVFVDGKRAAENRFTLTGGRHLAYVVLTEYWGHWRNDSEIRIISTEELRFENPADENSEGPWCFIPFSKDILYRFPDYKWALLSDDEQQKINRHLADVLRQEMNKVPTLNSFPKERARIVAAEESNASPHYLFTTREIVADAKAPVEGAEHILDGKEPVHISPSEAGDIEIAYDLGEQNVGYYDFEIVAEPGLIVDISGVEYIAPDGSVQHTERYRNGMRYICHDGVNHFTSLMRRSQRYVFLTFRNQTKPALLRKLTLVESTYPVQNQGAFSCSDERLTKIWEISARTLKLCMEDVFTDCPLYEQTLWVGDSRNEALFNFTAFGHADIARRCVRLAALSLDRMPLIQCQVPSTWETIIPVWGFLWNLMVWDYYEYSADKEFLSWVYPYALKNLKQAEGMSDDRGLFSAPFWNMFDWSGIDDGHRTVMHNSMFAVGAIDAAIKAASLLGKEDDLDWLNAYRKRLVDAMNALWRDDLGAYPDSVHDDGKVSDKVCIHNVFLPLLFDIAPEERKGTLLAHLISTPEDMTPIGSPFAILYMFAAMEKMGLQQNVIERIREAYIPMLDLDATTVWETFAGAPNFKAEFPTRSHTHAWSSAPILFLNRIVLGILPDGPGGTAFQISPHPCGLTWARGASASIRGPVSVDWKLDGDTLSVTALGPEGTRLSFVRNESLKGVTVVFNGQPVP